LAIISKWDTDEWLCWEGPLLIDTKPLKEAQGLAQLVDRLMKDDWHTWVVFCDRVQAHYENKFIRYISVGRTETQMMWVVKADTMWPVGASLECGDDQCAVVTKTGLRLQCADHAWIESTEIDVRFRRWLKDRILDFF